MPSAGSSEIDSREYAISYALHSKDDFPADFPLPGSDRDFHTGVFLPRDPPDWFGRSAYPARILLLSRGEVVILTHPKAEVAPTRVSIDALSFYEAGELFLIGWLRFVTAQSEWKLSFNRRCGHAITGFLRELRREYLQPSAENARREVHTIGPPPDLKFSNILAACLDEGEYPRWRLFSPPYRRASRFGPLGLGRRAGGNLLIFTDRRVAWVTDECEEHYERYGMVSRTAPVRTVARAARERGGLRVTFRDGSTWNISLPVEAQFSSQESHLKVNP